jgi:hypothetical protein
MANVNTDASIQAARNRFGREGEYPLIDDAEIIEDIEDKVLQVMAAMGRQERLKAAATAQRQPYTNPAETVGSGGPHECGGKK